MDKFEFFFSLLSLLLGLAMTQLAGGMASALKRRKQLHVGWVTPLAALVICLDIASFWPDLWASRSFVEIQLPHILTGVALCLGYYMAASFVFPDDLNQVHDLDAWYFQTRHFALGGTLALSIAFMIVGELMQGSRLAKMSVAMALWSLRGWLVYIALLLVALLAKDKRVCAGALIAIVMLYPLVPYLFS
jgi:hypothetical protein